MVLILCLTLLFPIITLKGKKTVLINYKERYKDAVGKTLILPLVGREIPVVADDYVGIDFGTGVVKITPAHDPNDFEVGLRHNLPVLNVMTEDAKIVDVSKVFPRTSIVHHFSLVIIYLI